MNYEALVLAICSPYEIDSDVAHRLLDISYGDITDAEAFDGEFLNQLRKEGLGWRAIAFMITPGLDENNRYLIQNRMSMLNKRWKRWLQIKDQEKFVKPPIKRVSNIFDGEYINYLRYEEQLSWGEIAILKYPELSERGDKKRIRSVSNALFEKWKYWRNKRCG